jgi:hypothetical protein
MNTNIELSNISNHFFLYDDENDENDKNNKKYKTKIINYCFYSINEANISDIIKTLNYYSNNSDFKIYSQWQRN